jgi:hypothetical protein
MQEPFENFLKRLIVVALLPNVLVWGFFEQGINHNSNPLWRFLVGPYWQLEVFLFYAVLAVIGLAAAVVLFGAIVTAAEYLWTGYQKWQDKKLVREMEKVREHELAGLERAQEIERLRFQALPEIERLRILGEKKRAADERQKERQLKIDELERCRQEKDAQAKREKELELQRIRELENSPDYQRKKALRGFVGGRLE